MSTRSSWLPGLLGLFDIQSDGVAWPAKRAVLNFSSNGNISVDLSDNPTTEVATLTMTLGTVPTTLGGTGLTTLGTAGQTLQVNGDADALVWVDGVPDLGTPYQVLRVNGDGGAMEWADVTEELPALGTAYQILRVNAGANGVEWATVSSSTPTGTGFRYVTSGVEDAATVKVDLTNSAHVTVPATANGVVTSSGTVLQQAAYVSAGSGYVSIGLPPAATGSVRLADGGSVVSRNTSDDGDLDLIAGSEDNVLVGAAGNPGKTILSAGTTIGAEQPILGEASPYGIHGQLIKAMSDTNQTLASGEYKYTIIRCTGALTADRTLTLPSPTSDARAYSKIIDNACTGSNLVVSTGAGATVTLTPGVSAWLIFDNTVGVREAVT